MHELLLGETIMFKNSLCSLFPFVSTLRIATLFAIIALSHANAADILMHCPFDNALEAKYAAGRREGLARTEAYVPGKIGQAVHINSADAEIVYSPEGNIDKAKGSIELWVKCNWEPDSKTQHAFFWENGPRKAGFNCIWIWKYGNSIRFDVRDPKDSYATASIKDWKPGEWHHIVATWDCTKGIALYFDGELKRERKTTWKAQNHGCIHIGNRPVNKMPAQTAIDELVIYANSLTPDEVKLAFAGKLERKPTKLKSSGKKATAKLTGKPELLFHLPFDGSSKASVAKGDAKPQEEKNLSYKKGLFGQAAYFGKDSKLRFLEKGNLIKERGTISFWFCPEFSGQQTHNEKGGEFWRTLFREGPPANPRVGSNETWIWLHGSRMRFDVADPEDNHLKYSISRWKADEWHYIVCTWDNQSGHSLYIDGERCAGGSSDKRKPFMVSSWETVPFKWFQIGGDASRHPADGLIDDLRIYDQPVSAAQAKAGFGDMYPVSPNADHIYYAVNSKNKLQWKLECNVTKSTKGTILWWIEDPDGKHITKTETLAIDIKPGSSARTIEGSFAPDTPGRYKLVCRWKPSDGREPYDRAFELWGIDINRTPKGTEKMDLEKVCEFDCSKPLGPDQLAESAPTQIVKAPCGSYLEAGNKRHSRFALRTTLPENNCAYIVEWEYPDDKPRTMEMISQVTDASSAEYELQTGLFTGDEYPLSNRMKTHRCLYWPRHRDSILIFMTAEDDHPAAVSKLRVFKVNGGIKRAASPLGGVPNPAGNGILNRLMPWRNKTEASDTAKRRHIGIYYEDPALCYDFGNQNSMPGFETLADRLITYMHYSGQDTFMYPGVWYHGPFYPSKSQKVSMSRPHPHNFIEYLLLRFEAEGIGYIPTINLHSLPSLAHHKWHSSMAFTSEAAEGALSVGWNGTPNLRGWHGTRPNYNIYHPEVKAAILTMVDEMLDLYGDSPAFKGICFHLTKHCMLWFGNLDGGYNDICVEDFQKDSGIKIPVANDDPMRVAKRYRWIMKNAREPWIDWRCKALRAFYGEVAAKLADRRPDLNLVLTLYRPVFRDVYPEPGQLPPGDFVRNINREGGVDPVLYADLPNVVLDRTIYPADYRWYRAHRGKGNDPVAIRDLLTSPQGYQSVTAGDNVWINMHDRYWEDAIGREKPNWKSLWGREHGWRVSTLNPTDRYALESYLIPLAHADIMTFTKGGFLIGTHGMENHLAAFSRAFRSLPARKFKDLEVEAPLTIRYLEDYGDMYLYAVNPTQKEAAFKVNLSGKIKTVTDLTTGLPISASSELNSPMPPMSFNAYRIEGRDVIVGK